MLFLAGQILEIQAIGSMKVVQAPWTNLGIDGKLKAESGC